MRWGEQGAQLCGLSPPEEGSESPQPRPSCLGSSHGTLTVSPTLSSGFLSHADPPQHLSFSIVSALCWPLPWPPVWTQGNRLGESGQEGPQNPTPQKGKTLGCGS